jgi:hypothetical protein
LAASPLTREVPNALLSRQTGFSFAEHPSDYQEKVDEVRRALGDDEFARLWSKGATMEYDDATGYALESG